MKAKDLAKILLETPDKDVWVQNYERDEATYIHRPTDVVIEASTVVIQCNHFN